MTDPNPSGRSRADIRTLMKFLLAGGACYLLNIAILFVAVEGFALHYVSANLLSLGVLILVGHSLNRHQTFRSRGRYVPELSRFALAMSVQTACAVGLIFILVEHLQLHYLAANLTASASFTVLSFAIQRNLVFRRADGSDSTHPSSS